MGDKSRRLAHVLLQTAFDAALPALIIYAILLGSFVLRGVRYAHAFSPADHLLLLFLCYITAFINACIMRRRALKRAFLRIDEPLIGKNFGGWRKQDKLFCAAMEHYQKEEFRSALELYLDIQEFPLTDEETGVLSFYIARCYQELGAPSNAVSYYVKAREHGFSEHYSMLFQARSHAEGGDFDASFAMLQTLLNSNPPKDFTFLYTDIGFLFIRQKLPQEAAKWFQQSIDRHMNYAFALSGMAIAALQAGDFRSARDYRYKALINRLENPSAFRSYYDETKRMMLEAHPEWAQNDAGEAQSDAAGADPQEKGM